MLYGRLYECQTEHERALPWSRRQVKQLTYDARDIKVVDDIEGAELQVETAERRTQTARGIAAQMANIQLEVATKTLETHKSRDACTSSKLEHSSVGNHK